MKRSIIFIVCILSLLTSCQKKEQLTSVDFGSGEFEEPFRGLLASHPSWLVATLDWPILRSLKSDTVILSKTIEIGFNEDAIRSNSSAKIFFVDENGYSSNKYQVFCNQEPIGLDGYEIKASAEPQQLLISIKIDPTIGDSTAIGYISILGNEIDEVNTIPLTEEGSQNIAKWSFNHEIGWPMLIWIIWFLLFLLALAIVVGIIYLIILLLSVIAKGLVALLHAIMSIQIRFLKVPKKPKSPKTKNNNEKKNDDDNKDKRKYYIWLQEKGEQNQLLRSFKLSNPEKQRVENLQSCIYWEETDYFKARVFKWRLHRFIKRHYHSYFRIRFKLEPLIDLGLPYIWIGTSCKNHLRELSIIKRPATEKNLKNCLYFHNTKLGNKRAQKLLDQINTYINEHYQ